jgi:hypothetical protein
MRGGCFAAQYLSSDLVYVPLPVSLIAPTASDLAV